MHPDSSPNQVIYLTVFIKIWSNQENVVFTPLLFQSGLVFELWDALTSSRLCGVLTRGLKGRIQT